MPDVQLTPACCLPFTDPFDGCYGLGSTAKETRHRAVCGWHTKLHRGRRHYPGVGKENDLPSKVIMMTKNRFFQVEFRNTLFSQNSQCVMHLKIPLIRTKLIKTKCRKDLLDSSRAIL